jgi:hypothetical protein
VFAVSGEPECGRQLGTGRGRQGLSIDFFQRLVEDSWMPSIKSHTLKLAEDKRTVRIEIVRDGRAQWDDLARSDVDLLIDALGDLREQMIEDDSS